MIETMPKKKTSRERLDALVGQYPDWTVQKYADYLDLAVGRVHELLVLLGYRKQWTKIHY